MKKEKQSKTQQSKKIEDFVEGKKQTVNVSGNKLEDVLTSLNFTPETMLVTVDGKVTLPSSKIPSGKNKIELFKVVSGG